MNKDKIKEIEKISEKFLKCPICDDKYFEYNDEGVEKIPKILECHHTFCQECIKKTFLSKPTSLTTNCIPCLVCRKSTYLNKGLPSLITDFKVKEIQEAIQELEASQNFPQTMKTSASSCQVCEGKNNKVKSCFFCLDCKKNLCQSCFKKHKNISFFSIHHYIELSSGKMIEPKEGGGKCKNHNFLLEYLCKSCKEKICSIELQLYHDNHEVVKLTQKRSEKEEEEEEEDDISADYIETLSQCITETKKEMEILENLGKELISNFENEKKKLEKSYKEARLKLEEHNCHLLKELEKQKLKGKELEVVMKKKANIVKEAEKKIKQLKSSNRKPEVEELESLYLGMSEALPKLTLVSFEPSPPSCSFGETNQREEEIKKRLVDDVFSPTPKLERKFFPKKNITVSRKMSESNFSVTMVTEPMKKDSFLKVLRNILVQSNPSGEIQGVQNKDYFEACFSWDTYLPMVERVCFASKGHVVVALSQNTEPLDQKIKFFNSSSSLPYNFNLDFSQEEVSKLCDVFFNDEKKKLEVLCVGTDGKTLIKKFKINFPKTPENKNEPQCFNCDQTTNLSDLTKSDLRDPIAFHMNKKYFALLHKNGKQLEFMTSNFSPLFSSTHKQLSYVAVTSKGEVVVSDVADGKIKAYNKKEDITFNMDFNNSNGSSMRPQGLHVDKNFCILVADQNTEGVLLFGQEGFTDQVLRGMSHPSGLSYSHNTHLLAVTNRTHVCLFKV